MIKGTKTVIAIAALLACLQAPTRVEAWGASGHRVIANIAYDRLDEPTRTGIVKILRKHEDFEQRFKPRMPEAIVADSAEEDRWIFLHASIWPDLVRGTPAFHHDTWHYCTY